MSGKDGNMALGFAQFILQTAATVTGQNGGNGAYLQVFDAEPEDENGDPDVANALLDRVAARNLLRRRVETGFDGLLGFSCLDVEESRIYVEAFDTRQDLGFMIAAPIRKTLFGNYRPVNGASA